MARLDGEIYKLQLGDRILRVTIDIPESLDLGTIIKSAKLRMAMQQTGFSSLTEIEKLGIAVLAAIEKAGVYTEKTKKPKRAIRK